MSAAAARGSCGRPPALTREGRTGSGRGARINQPTPRRWRGSQGITMTTKHALGGLAATLIIGALFAPMAGASPRLWTDSSEATPLRSITSTPKNQPDALEFDNEGPVVFL